MAETTACAEGVEIVRDRVVGRNGSLTGYAGGLERKARLLALEANDVLF